MKNLEERTILRGWEKTKLTEGMEFPDPFESEDAEEELMLQSAMDDLMLDENEISNDENDEMIELVLEPIELVSPETIELVSPETIELVFPETTIDVVAVPEKSKNKKQSRITDFFTAK